MTYKQKLEKLAKKLGCEISTDIAGNMILGVSVDAPQKHILDGDVHGFYSNRCGGERVEDCYKDLYLRLQDVDKSGGVVYCNCPECE